MTDIDVLREATLNEALEESGGAQPLPCRWVDLNKGDQSRPQYRSRLVRGPGGGRRST